MDNLEHAKIYQQTFKQNGLDVIYTTIWQGYTFELWAHVKGYAKAAFIYGGNTETGMLLVYEPLSVEQLQELTGETID